MSELNDYRERLLTLLAAQPRLLANVLDTIPATHWQLSQNAKGHTVHQVVVHLRDLEHLAFLPRLRRILVEDEPTLQPFPNHHWSLAHYQPTEPMATLLTDLNNIRAQVLQLLQGLDSTAWNRVGFHAPSGWRTAQWWVERLYNHAREHMEDLQQLSAQ